MLSTNNKEQAIMSITITAPREAVCRLYVGVPEGREYHATVKPERAIAATRVTTKNDMTTYYYEGLEPGLYHCGVSQEGYNALCQTINHTGDTHLNVELDKLAGNGYEAGYVMQYTKEFLEKQLVSHKHAWGETYAKLFCTPQFSERRVGRHRQTTNEEMMDFVERLACGNAHMHIYSLGKSPKYGYDMPLILFTRETVENMTLEQAAKVIRENGKPTVQYAAQCHSTEPASTEGALAMMASLCGDYGKVLDAEILVDVRGRQAALCQSGCETAADVLLGGLPGGIRCGELAWEGLQWEKETELFLRRGKLACRAVFVAKGSEDGGAFLDFELKGVMTT
jgi:hypothetical protein